MNVSMRAWRVRLPIFTSLDHQGTSPTGRRGVTARRRRAAGTCVEAVTAGCEPVTTGSEPHYGWPQRACLRR
jgi:hypothetical protein